MQEKERTRQAFAALLRSGLWNRPLESAALPSLQAPDWKGIFRIAQQQAVWGVVADAVNRLPADRQPAPQALQQLNFLLSRNRTRHAQLNQTLAEAVTLLQEDNIRPILLKGQGVATYYADPTLRICGDIDLYIGEDDYKKSCLWAKQWGEDKAEDKERKQNTESVKHYHFRHGGVTVELHRIAGKLPNPRQNRKFQQWTKEMLTGEKCRRVRIGTSDITVPPADFELLYIFNHAYHHFLISGIGLRQLCDWTLALHRFYGQTDSTRLKGELKAFGLWCGWQIFGCIAVDTLGLPEAEFPFYDGAYRQQADKVLKHIFEDGNFGFFSPIRTERPAGYIAGKWHTFKYMHHRFLHLFPLFPKEITGIWYSYLLTGTIQVIKDKQKKQNSKP